MKNNTNALIKVYYLQKESTEFCTVTTAALCDTAANSIFHANVFFLHVKSILAEFSNGDITRRPTIDLKTY